MLPPNKAWRHHPCGTSPTSRRSTQGSLATCNFCPGPGPRPPRHGKGPRSRGHPIGRNPFLHVSFVNGRIIEIRRMYCLLYVSSRLFFINLLSSFLLRIRSCRTFVVILEKMKERNECCYISKICSFPSSDST